MLKIAIGVAIALFIGAACRYFDIPVPAPPKLVGALLILAVTVGYLGMDVLMRQNAAPPAAGETEQVIEPPTSPQ